MLNDNSQLCCITLPAPKLLPNFRLLYAASMETTSVSIRKEKQLPQFGCSLDRGSSPKWKLLRTYSATHQQAHQQLHQQVQQHVRNRGMAGQRVRSGRWAGVRMSVTAPQLPLSLVAQHTRAHAQMPTHTCPSTGTHTACPTTTGSALLSFPSNHHQQHLSYP